MRVGCHRSGDDLFHEVSFFTSQAEVSRLHRSLPGVLLALYFNHIRLHRRAEVTLVQSHHGAALRRSAPDAEVSRPQVVGKVCNLLL